MLLMLVAATVRLTFIQGWDATSYADKSANQRLRDNKPIPAQRGAINDRTGTAVAFSVEGRKIGARPNLLKGDVQRQQIIDVLVAELGDRVSATTLREQLTSVEKFVYLVSNLMPAEADAVMAKITKIIGKDNLDAVVADSQPVRVYPDGGLSASVVGQTSEWAGAGTMGIESRFNSLLAGVAGVRTYDVYGGGIIPGTVRNEKPVQNGSDLTLTLDSDLQFSVTQMVQQYVDQVGAKRGMALVEDVATGQIYAISTYQRGGAERLANIAVSAPFEPGSVNKVVTFAAALESGLITPDSTFQVADSVQMGGRTIHDAWRHPTVEMTATGILAKSSNVGTLQIAQKLGADAFAAELKRFGLGSPTGIELAGESSGSVPAQDLWSATTFANLPIGQGLSMTLVQLASMYQAIGNGGVRLPPTLVMGTSTDGTYTASPAGTGTEVMSRATADTLRDMLRATTQDGDIAHRGTASKAAITGYQVAGKTGTAQQVDPVTKSYSSSLYTSTFAGLVPADNPRFVIAIMLDAPQNGKNAVPLFHDIAAYAMRAFDVPPSPQAAPIYDLYLNYRG